MRRNLFLFKIPFGPEKSLTYFGSNIVAADYVRIPNIPIVEDINSANGSSLISIVKTIMVNSEAPPSEESLGFTPIGAPNIEYGITVAL